MPAQIILTRRHSSILVTVFLFGGCSTVHVARRFFGHLKSERVAYRCIARLAQDGYLVTRRLPSSTGVGSGRLFLTVGPKGRAVVAQALGLSASELARSRIDAPRFIDHHLATCNTRVSVELAVERSNFFTLVEWSRDRQIEVKVKEDQTGRELTLVPDGAFRLGLPDGRNQRFFLEQDTGTMSSTKRMRERLAGYLLASRTSPVPVLFVTTTDQRLAAIANLALDEAQQLAISPTIFWLTTKDRLTEETVLNGSIWQVAGLSSPVSISSLALGSKVDGLSSPPGKDPSIALAAALGMPVPSGIAAVTRSGGYPP